MLSNDQLVKMTMIRTSQLETKRDEDVLKLKVDFRSLRPFAF